jgi:subtilase family serine protease
VTVANQSNNPYSGPLVVAISGESIARQEVVVSAEMAANGGTVVVQFALNPPVTVDGTRVVVEADPQNAVRELREDNNSATFVLLAPEDSPNIIIQQPLIDAGSIVVTIQNTGGSLTTTNITVRVVFGQSVNSQAQTLALANGQSATFTVARPPGQGDAVAEVVIAGQVVASAPFQLTP